MRCHIVRDKGGNVGPELNGIGKKYDRRTLLESIVNPNAKIADGFQSVVLALKDGTVVAGVLRKETPEEVTVILADTKIVVVPTKEIEERAKGISAMPGDLVQKLSKSEIRDVIEYLSTLKDAFPK
jgi:quinoprotein glucose dehydrogenase